MGMDVYGRNPDSEAGEYFRANVWSWRPIHSLVIELCSDLLDKDTIEGMGYNSGHGPDNQEVCTQMANRFDQWMEHNVDGLQLDLGMYVDEENRLSTAETELQNPDAELRPAHEVEDEHIKEWIDFLRHCGGFEVW